MSMSSIKREPQKSLTAMTLAELQDLLQRQERLVANKSFVNKLPDKGEKMLGLIERVTAAMKTHRQVDETADLFQQLALNADTARRKTMEDQEDSNMLSAIVNQPLQEKVLVDERTDERGHDRGDDIYFTETYKRVIKTPNKGELVTERFVPNRIPQRLAAEKKLQQKTQNAQPETAPGTVTQNAQPETAPGTVTQNAQPDSSGAITVGRVTSQQEANSSRVGTDGTRLPGRRLRHRYDDSLEEDMRGAPGVHDKTKMISIEESVGLLQTQKKQQEEVQSQQAMERLAQRLGIKVDKVTTFDPEGSRKMAYRVTEEIDSDDDDSDDDAKEKDYPDEPSSGTKVTSSRSGLRQSALGSVKSQHVVK